MVVRLRKPGASLATLSSRDPERRGRKTTVEIQPRAMVSAKEICEIAVKSVISR